MTAKNVRAPLVGARIVGAPLPVGTHEGCLKYVTLPVGTHEGCLKYVTLPVGTHEGCLKYVTLPVGTHEGCPYGQRDNNARTFSNVKSCLGLPHEC